MYAYTKQKIRHNIVSFFLLLNILWIVFIFLCSNIIKISVIFSFMSIPLQFSAPLNRFFFLRLMKEHRRIIFNSYPIFFSYPSTSKVHVRVLELIAFLFCCFWRNTEFKHALSLLTTEHHQTKETFFSLGLLSAFMRSP